MTIEEYFNSCQYINSFKRAAKYKILETIIKPTWKLPKTEGIEANVREKKEGLVEYWFFSETKTFDELYEWFIGSVVRPNIENEQKEKLLKQKVQELKDIFQTNSLDELQNLSFNQEEDTSLDITPTEEIVEEEDGATN
jgi:hypothetical protein